MTAIFLLGAVLLLILAWTAWGDIARRDIPHWIAISIVLLAPLWWWANALPLWPDVAIRLGLALVVFAAFTGVWTLGMMGGGDVKLLAALALWFSPLRFVDVLYALAIVGAVVTLWMIVLHRRRRAEGKPEVPYAVAIALAAGWVLSNQILTIATR